jgi:hypothetical protein
VFKLAFWDTVNAAYRYVFTHPLTVLRAGWLYLLIGAIHLSVRKGEPFEPGPALLAGIVAILLIAASIAWHIALFRAILLNESTWSAAVQFRRRHWRLVGVGILLFLILVPATAIVAGIGVVLVHAGGPAAIGGVLIIVVAVTAVIIVASRFYLLGPAIATDDPAKAIRAAWRRSHGNTFRLLFGGLLMILPAIIVLAVVGGGAGLLLFVVIGGGVPLDEWMMQLGFASRTAIGLVQAIVQLVVGALSIAFYALAYRQLAQNWNPPAELTATQLDT